MTGLAAPVIGLTAYAEPARWAGWHARVNLLPASYADQVRRAGAVPVLLPPVPGVAAAIGRLDGLILTGGGDLDPASYGARPDPETARVCRERDEAEFSLLAAALAARLPVLGICRGLQVLNVALGGSLRQHLPPQAGHTPPPGTFGAHRVRIAPGTRLAAILGRAPHTGGGRPPGGEPGGGDPGPLSLTVPTAHHQAVETLGDGLGASAWAEDGVIEALELAAGPHHPFTLAVQWHPEAGTDLRLLQALTAAAAGREAGA